MSLRYVIMFLSLFCVVPTILTTEMAGIRGILAKFIFFRFFMIMDATYRSDIKERHRS